MKLEKFHELYNVHRPRFERLDDFVVWYNGRPNGALNLWEAETLIWLLSDVYGQRYGWA